MGRRTLTSAELRAYRDLARAAKRLRQAQRQAELLTVPRGTVVQPDAKPAEPLPLLLSDRQAAALLGVSRATVHRLRSAGRFPEATRLGRKLLFDRRELELWVE